jgi:predicted transcriptional regulator
MADKDDLAERLSFRIPAAWNERIEQIADRHEWSRSQAARHALKRGIERDDDGGGLAA